MCSIVHSQRLTQVPWKHSTLSNFVNGRVHSANHLYSLVSHIFSSNLYGSSKFYEYLLHHGMAVFLIFYSYMIGIWLIGTMVLIFHDFSDTFLIIGRFYLVGRGLFRISRKRTKRSCRASTSSRLRFG